MTFALKNHFCCFCPGPHNQQVHTHQGTGKWWVEAYLHQGVKGKNLMAQPVISWLKPLFAYFNVIPDLDYRLRIPGQ